MKTTSWLGIGVLGVLAACGSSAGSSASERAEEASSGAEAVSEVASTRENASAQGEPAAPRLFGQAPTEQGETVALTDIVSDPGQWAGKTVLVEGTIGKVCERKGCWMDLSQGGVSVRIPMAGHSFFLPQDVVGHEALVQGTVRLVEPEGEGAEAAHDEGAHADHDHPEGVSCQHAAGRKVLIEASGVLVR